MNNAIKRTAIALALTILPVQSLAGDAGRAYREGLDFAKAGQEYKAAMGFLDALDADVGHKKALESLRAITKAAYEEHLALAEESERGGEYVDALEAYRDLVDFLKRSKQFDAVSFSVADVKSKVAEMENSAAEAEYRTAETNFGSGQWEKAVAGYKAALSFTDAYKDSDAKIRTAYYKWADSDYAAGQIRSSIKHFYDSWKAGATDDAQRRAATIQASLAAHFQRTGDCRRAVKEYDTASKILSTPGIAAGLESARACAVTPVAMMTVENPTGVNPAGSAVGELLSDSILAATRRGASEFLKVIERDALDVILAEQGISGFSATANPKGVKGVRYILLGKLTQMSITRPTPTRRTLTGSGQQAYRCTQTGYDGRAYETECLRDVQVTYDETTLSAALRMVLSLRVVDVATGTQVGMDSIEVVKEDRTVFGGNFHFANGVGVAIAPRHLGSTTGDVVSAAMFQLASGKQDVASDDALLQDALGDITARAAERIIGWIDTPGPAKDPSSVTLVAID